MKNIRKDTIMIENVKVFSDGKQHRINTNKCIPIGNYNIILIPLTNSQRRR